MRFIIIGMMFLWISICGLQPTIAAEENLKTYRLMIFGDSLSAGYKLPKDQSFAVQLQKALNEAGYTQVKVINKSRSGETTGGGLKRQMNALSEKPNGVILELGINDILRGNSIATITKNLSDLIQNFQSNNVAVLLAGMKAPPITEPVYARQFEAMYYSLAQKYKVELYPFFMQGIFEAAGNQYEQAYSYLNPDHVHPSDKGVDLMVRHMLPRIITFLKQQKVFPMK